MIVIDIIRCFTLQPVLNFSTNSESQKQNHKRFNIAYLAFTLFMLLLIIAYKWNGLHSINDFMDLFTWLIAIYLGMCALGLVMQIIQCLEKSNQPKGLKDPNSPIIEFKQTKPRGRTALPRVEEGDDPLKDGAASAALSALMETYGTNLSSVDGGIIINSLMANKSIFLKKEYEKVSLSVWLYHRYRSHFKSFEPKSMTTTTGLDQQKLEDYSKFLKDKYYEIKDRK